LASSLSFGVVKAIDPLVPHTNFMIIFRHFTLGFLMPLSLTLAVFMCTAEFISGFSVLTGLRQKTGILGVRPPGNLHSCHFHSCTYKPCLGLRLFRWCNPSYKIGKPSETTNISFYYILYSGKIKQRDSQ